MAFLSDKLPVIISIALISFGTFNIINNAFAADEISKTELDFTQTIILLIVEHFVTQIGPIVGGVVGLGIQFARKKGLQISAEAEEYLVKMTSSFVANQSKWMYEQLRDNPDKWEYDEKTGSFHLPKKLGEAAKKNVMEQLRVELRSDEFTKITRSMLEQNLDSLVERAVTQNNKELSERSRGMIHDIAPLIIDSLLLSIQSKENAQQKKQEIIDDAMKSIKKHFDYEEIPYDGNFASIMLKAELNKRIGNILSNS